MPDSSGSGRWTEVSRIVDAALDLDVAQRDSFIDGECSHDAALEREVREFLAACDEVGRSPDFMGGSPKADARALAESLDRNLAAARSGFHARVAAALADRYVLQEELGHGGTSTVHRAVQVSTGQVVALKVLRPELALSVGAERFQREVRIVASLRHPNIIPLLDAGMVDGVPFYVMPCVEGQTLRSRLERDHVLPTDLVVSIAAQVAAALDEAHARDILHRDIKPQNILLDGDRVLVADFGIARPFETAVDDKLTEAGTLIGTPSYMSPEQAGADAIVDRRSDVYSLACMVYEMLTGGPPYTGRQSNEVLAKHVVAPIPDPRVARPVLPGSVSEVLRKALAKQAADRPASAGTFVGELERAFSRPGAERRKRLFARMVVAAGVVVAVSLAASRHEGLSSSTDALLDTTRVMVLPIVREGGSAGTIGVDDGLLHESLSRWQGLSLVDRFLVSDAVKQHGAPRTIADAVALARLANAGRFVRSQLAAHGAGTRLYISLYDVRSSAQLKEVSADVPADPAAARELYARLADSLALRGTMAPASSRSWTRSLPALQSVARAQLALDDWNLASADSALETALTHDPVDPWINLQVAQVRLWRNAPVARWLSAAAVSDRAGEELSGRDRTLARALVALGGGKYLEACRLYDGLTRENPRDFTAWYGLGQCRRMDRMVIRDARSPGGWRFRADYDSAFVAYATAFEIFPGALRTYEPGSFDRLRGLLLLSSAVLTGRSIEDSSLFYGRLGLVGGRSVLVPFDWRKIVEGGASATPPGFQDALALQRKRLHQIASRWSSAHPKNGTAKAAVALSLELMGNALAIDTLALARRLSDDLGQRTRLAVSEVAVLLKFGFPDRPELLVRAAVLADSLLAGRDSNGIAVESVIVLAALRGRCGIMNRYGRQVPFPTERLQLRIPEIAARSQAILASSSLGCPAVDGALSGLVSLARKEFRGIPPAELDTYMTQLFSRSALLATPPDSAAIDLLGQTVSNDLLRAWRAFVRRDTVEARMTLVSFASRWDEASVPPTPDIGLPEASLFLALADTSSAITWLDRSLYQALAWDPEVLTDHATLAALVRAAILRAQIADRRNDSVTSRRIWPAVRALWFDADHPLRIPLDAAPH